MTKGLATVLLSLACIAPAAAATTLVKDGHSEYAILIAADAPPAIRHAAAELRDHIQKISGAELPVRTQGDGPAPRHAIVIRTDPALAEEELRIRTEPPGIIISGGGSRGALYGCYAFLEDVLGCRWYTSRISKVPHRKTIRLDDLDIRQKPGFEYREPFFTEAFARDWALRNRANGNAQQLDASVGGRVAYGKFVHTFNELVPPGEYFAQHPEYFAMVGGKRVADKQLCLTNPDVLRISIARMRKWIQDYPDATLFSVSQNDTYGNCECPACAAVDKEEGAPSGSLLRFVNAVGEAVAKDHPRVLIDTLAYQYSEKPPRHVKPVKNVRVRLAPIYACFGHALDGCSENAAPLANLKAWAGITDQLYVWHYCTNFANYFQPLPGLDEIAAGVPLFRDNGVVGLFYEGDYAPVGGGEMAELKSYLLAKLMWDPSRPAQPIIDEFVNAVYGKGAPYIHQWLSVLHGPVRAGTAHPRIYDPPTAPYLSDETLKEGVRLFDAAEKATARDPVALDEVQRARLALEYVQLMRAPEGEGRRALAKTVAEKVRRYRFGQAREGEPIEHFLARIEKQG